MGTAQTSIPPALPAAESITHQHLLSVIDTELGQRPTTGPVRVLDVGCGNGHLLAYLARCLPLLHPQRAFEFYGLDVFDEGVQAHEFIARSQAFLQGAVPDLPWDERIVSVSSAAAWPFADDYFDVCVSNQVLEHVRDHGVLFAELSRTLRPGAFSAHLFPLRHYVFETHLRLPWVHRLHNHLLLQRYIRLLSRIGLGKYRGQLRAAGVSPAEYAERHADYMHHYTNYLSQSDVFRLGKRHRLRTSFRYSWEFYGSKLRSLLKLKPRRRYAVRRSLWGDWVLVFLLRYLSSITLFLEKRDSYVNP